MTIIRSQLFSSYPGLTFGMSTNTGGVSPAALGLNLSYSVGDDPENVRKNREIFFSSLGIAADKIAFTRQQHTVNVSTVSVPGVIDECDALCTKEKNVFLAISIADCTPVMLVDPVTTAVAGIHAGWRGTAGRIVVRTIERMKADFGTDPRNIIAWIGPSAGKCCYEVGKEVVEHFEERSFSSKENGKFMLDVKHANMLQLLDSGVPNSNIEVHPDCSIHHSLYHSHRRDGKGSGRMLAVIGFTY